MFDRIKSAFLPKPHAWMDRFIDVGTPYIKFWGGFIAISGGQIVLAPMEIRVTGPDVLFANRQATAFEFDIRSAPPLKPWRIRAGVLQVRGHWLLGFGWYRGSPPYIHVDVFFKRFKL